MSTFEFWSLAAYFSQLGAIVWGIWTIKHASDLRDRAHERRHTESMNRPTDPHRTRRRTQAGATGAAGA